MIMLLKSLRKVPKDYVSCLLAQASRTQNLQTLPSSHPPPKTHWHLKSLYILGDIGSLTSSWISRASTVPLHRFWDIICILVLSANMHKDLAAFFDNVNPSTRAHERSSGPAICPSPAHSHLSGSSTRPVSAYKKYTYHHQPRFHRKSLDVVSIT